MKVKDLIEELKKLPPDIEVWVDCSTDYDEHKKVTGIVKGNAGSGMAGGYFVQGRHGFNAIELI